MPLAPPPARLDRQPNRIILPRGIELWRVHNKLSPIHAFNPVEADEHFGGGRFDSSPGDSYPYFYAAFTQATALAEAFLPGLPYPDAGGRILPRQALLGRRLSAVQLSEDLTLVALISTVDLAAISQDEWLVRAEAREYAHTRRWGHWLRAQAPWAQGYIWQSKRNHPERSVILFGDRCGPDLLRPARLPAIDLDAAASVKWLNHILAPYRVAVHHPGE